MTAVLCTMAVVVLMAIAGCRPDYEHCTSGPGWRSECTERRTGLPSGRSDDPDRLTPPGVDRVRAEVERDDDEQGRAPSAPQALVGASFPDGAPTRLHGMRIHG